MCANLAGHVALRSLYFRRAKQLQLNWWDSRYLEELIAADVLDGDSDATIPDPFEV